MMPVSMVFMWCCQCIFDRIEASHKIGLLDLWMKYAEVISTEQTVEYLHKTTGAP